MIVLIHYKYLIQIIWGDSELIEKHKWTHQWSVLRLGGAVQSFRGLSGLPHAPLLMDSTIISAATLDSLSWRVGFIHDKGEELNHW